MTAAWVGQCYVTATLMT